MQHDLEIELKNEPAALERVLQVTRYRQFQVEAMDMHKSDQDKLTVRLKVSGSQSINILTSQLNKLYDLANLKIEQKVPFQVTA